MSFPAPANSTAPAGPPAPAAPPHPPPFNVSSFMFDIDVFLLCCVGVFFLLLLPRATIRFTHKREWVDGHFLRSIRLPRPPPVVNRHSPVTAVSLPQAAITRPGYSREYSDKEKWADTSDASHTYVSSHHDVLRKASTATRRERRRHNAPTHIPGWSTILATPAAFLRRTITPGLTIGKSIILLGYFATILFAGLYKSNPFTDHLRTGFVAVSQIPVVVLLGTKHNLLGLLIGFGYERLNYFHRFAGRLFVLAANIHAIGYFFKWSNAGTFAKDIAEPIFTWALVALICADLLLLLSTEFVRARFYNAIFIPSHIISAVLMMVAVCEHVPVAKPYVYIATALYGLDRLLRLLRSRITTAHLTPLPDLSATRVEIPSINAGWRAGQHVRLRVLSLGMGWRAWSESHPFTIASVSRSPSGDGLVLLVKSAGDWTARLYALAARAPSGKPYADDAAPTRRARVCVEGPYGGPGHALLASFAGALLVAGGSGITFALAAARDLVQKHAEGRARTRAATLLWTVQDPAALAPLLPALAALLGQAQDAGASLRVVVHYTRAPANANGVDANAVEAMGALPRGLTLSPARPDVGKALGGVVDRASALFGEGAGGEGEGALTGVVVGVCGPAGLGESVRRAVEVFDVRRRRAVGGIEVHEEAFGW